MHRFATKVYNAVVPFILVLIRQNVISPFQDCPTQRL